MAIQVADIFADLSLHTTKFRQDLNKAISTVKTAGAQMSKAIGSESTDGLKQIQKEAQKTTGTIESLTWSFRSGFKDMGKVMSGIIMAQAFYRALEAIKMCVSEVIKFDMELQNAAISFEVLMGSADEANRFIYALQDFAAKTPFAFQDAELGARRLMAVGFSAENVIPIMKDVTDAVAAVGGNAETLERVTRAFGQIKTKGRLLGEEMRQLHEAMIPAAAILKEELGLTSEQLANIADQQIPAGVAIKAILTGIEKRYGGTADKITQTTGGLLNNLADNFRVLGASVFQIPLEGLRKGLSTIESKVQELMEASKEGGFKGFVEALFSPQVAAAIMGIINAFRLVGSAVSKLITAIAPLAKAFSGVFLLTFSIVAQVLAILLNTIARLASAVIKAAPWLKYLAAMIASLLVAKMVYGSLLALRAAIIGLSIASIVAKAVTALQLAISTLSLALLKNPITALISIICAALVYLIFTIAQACGWLDALGQKIAQFAGLGDIFAVGTDTADYSSAIEDYNKALGDTAENTEDVGDAAEGAGKKIKDSFLASFDEVYTIPDQVGDVGSAFEDIGSMVDVPKIDIGSILTSGTGALDDLINDLEMIPIVIGKIPDQKIIEIRWATYGFGEAAREISWATDAVRVLVTEWGKLLQWIPNFSTALQGLSNGIADWAAGLAPALLGIPAAFNNAFDEALNYLHEQTGSISAWFANEFASCKQSISALGPMLGTALEAIRQSISANLDKLSFGALSDSISNLAVSLGRVIPDLAKSISDLSVLLLGLGAALGNSISSWGKTWAANLGIAFANFKESCRTQVADWVRGFSVWWELGGKKIVLVVSGVVAAIVIAIVALPAEAIAAVGAGCVALGAALWSGLTAVFTGGSVTAAATAGAASVGTAITLMFGSIAALLGIHYVNINDTADKQLEKTRLMAKKKHDEMVNNAIEAYARMDNGVAIELTKFKITSETITEQTAANVVTTISKMASDIKATLDTNLSGATTTLTGLFDVSGALSSGEEAQILSGVSKFYTDQKALVETGEAEIKAIIAAAIADQRPLREDEYAKITAIQQTFKDTYVKTLSDTERESKVLLEKMAAATSTMTAEQLSAVIKNSLEIKKTTIENAEATYSEQLRIIIKQRDETGAISEEQARILIGSATTVRDETIAKAEETHQGVVTAAKTQSSEHIKEVDFETGEVKSKVKIMVDSIKTSLDENFTNLKTNYANQKTETTAYWTEKLATMRTKYNTQKTETATWLNEQKLGFTTWLDTVGSSWDTFWNNLGLSVSNGFDAAKESCRAGLNSIINLLNNLISDWNALSFYVPPITIGDRVFGGVSIGMPQIGQIPWLAAGGVATKATIAGIGEAGKPEAVMPLSESVLAPFADMIASNMKQETSGTCSSLPPLYVGTLIADERGIAELEKKMSIYRVSETKRVVGGR